MRVALIGGSGFVGHYIVERLLAAGHQAVLLLRPGSQSKRQWPDRVETIEGDLKDQSALEQLMLDCDAFIYLVGILRESKGASFEETQYRGVVRSLDAAKRAGVDRFLLMSANGVKPGGTPYQDSKYRAEQAAIGSGLATTIFRPSVIFGDPSGLSEIGTQMYRDMIKPPLPAVAFHTGWRPKGGDILMSPAHVADVADAFVAALGRPETIGQTIEIGGGETLSWHTMLERVAGAVGKDKLIASLPIAAMWPPALLFDWLSWFPVTRDQLTMLAEGNSASPDALAALIGREPRRFSAEELAYLN